MVAAGKGYPNAQAHRADHEQTYAAENARLAKLTREVFANPFRPISVAPAWLAWNGGTIMKLAQAIYEDREFDRHFLASWRSELMARAWELAEGLAKRPTLLLRYTRLLLTEALRRQMHDLLGYGLGMELLALIEKPEAPAS
jgi:enoyl-CoA hydratase/carnithine racemase